MYYVLHYKPYTIEMLEGFAYVSKDDFRVDTLEEAKVKQCEVKIKIYQNRLKHTSKKDRPRVRKKMSRLNKRVKAIKKEYPECFI